MGYWSVLVPEAATNLVTNPSIEVDTTGYTASGSGASIARITTARHRGLACLEVTPGAGVNNGVYYGTVALTTGVQYTASVDIKGGARGVPMRIYFADTSGTLKGSAGTISATLYGWDRVSVTWLCDSSASYRIYVTKNNSASTSVFTLDGLQVVQSDHDTSYVDGYQEGCKWNGVKHASTSTRPASSRAGGQEINLATYEVSVLAELGIGIPPAKHLVNDQALFPGASFLGRKVMPRTIDLRCQVKGDNYADLHSLRKDLLGGINPDLVNDDQEFWLKYVGSNIEIPVYIRVTYDSGLEFGDPDMYLDEFTLRFIAYDPFFYEEGNDAKLLTTDQSIGNADYILHRLDGEWQTMDATGMDGVVRALARGPDGTIYAGGDFHTAGGATVNHIAKWPPGGGWAAMGTTGTSGPVYALAVGPDGSLYAGGLFTTAGGVTVNNIAKWNGSAWSALGATPGANDEVDALAFDKLGNLYVGGAFTTAGGVTVNRIAKWDGAAWTALGATPGANSVVRALAVTDDNNPYIGGDFTTAGGVTVNRVAYFNITTSTWTACGSGCNYAVRALAFGADNKLYAGGDFGTAGGVTALYIARWTGGAWEALSSGANAAVWAICPDRQGIIYVGGAFTTMGGLTTTLGLALWNGSTFAHMDVKLPSTPVVKAILEYDGDVYVGYDTSGTATAAEVQTISNTSTRRTFPVLHVKRSGGTSARLELLENLTTGKRLWFNYALLDGEELIVDLQPGEPSAESSFFGSVWRALLRNSEFSEFCLLPGNNDLAAFVYAVGSPTVTMWLEWRVAHWGAEGAAL